MTRSVEECKKYNLDSVRLLFSGAAPLGQETIQDIKRIWPKWSVAQGYGKGKREGERKTLYSDIPPPPPKKKLELTKISSRND